MTSNTNIRVSFATMGFGRYARATVLAILFFLWGICCVFDQASAEELQTFLNCKLVKTEWSDGDSFQVELEDGKRFTVRLYGVDCVEYHVSNSNTDGRRLRSQRRYFGIARYGGSAQSSIKAAKQFGADAKRYIERKLEQPFRVSTAFADARGDGKHKRYYAFITTKDGADLGEQLVGAGLARAFGVRRKTPTGESRDDYRDSLRDVEFQAAIKRKGVWAATDWESLPAERRLEREEAAELELAIDNQPDPSFSPDEKLDLNTAPRDELMRLSGVGEVIANRIIENRPYQTIEEVGRVEGIGSVKLKRILPILKLSNKQDANSTP